MKNEFDMTNLRKMIFFLGVEVTQTSISIYISQRKYAQEISLKLGMENRNPTKTPMVSDCKLIKDEEGIKANPT